MGSCVPRSRARSQAAGQAMATAEGEGLLWPRAVLGLFGPRCQPGRRESVAPELSPGNRTMRRAFRDPSAEHGRGVLSPPSISKKTKKTAGRTPLRAKEDLPDSRELLADLRELIEAARAGVAQAVYSAQVILHWRV